MRRKRALPRLGQLTPEQRKHLNLILYHRYLSQESQDPDRQPTHEQIAERIGIRAQVVSELLQVAAREGLVRTWAAPVHADELALRLRDRYPVLARATVATMPAQEGELGPAATLRLVGSSAAREFENLVGELRPEERIIGLASSTSVSAMVRELTPRTFEGMHVVGLDAFTHFDAAYSAAGLVGAMAAVYRLPEGRTFVLPAKPTAAAPSSQWEATEVWHRVRQRIQDTRIAVVAIGVPGEGLLPKTLSFLGEDVTTAIGRGAVGDIRYRLIDGNGHTVDSGLERFSILTADDIRAMSEEGNQFLHDMAGKKRRYVMAIASGPKKAPAIRAALLGRYINWLVTCEHTARRLLGPFPPVG